MSVALLRTSSRSQGATGRSRNGNGGWIPWHAALLFGQVHAPEVITPMLPAAPSPRPPRPGRRQDYPKTIINVLSMRITGVAYFEDSIRPTTTLYSMGVGSDLVKHRRLQSLQHMTHSIINRPLEYSNSHTRTGLLSTGTASTERERPNYVGRIGREAWPDHWTLDVGRGRCSWSAG